jgi:hypothetical protein
VERSFVVRMYKQTRNGASQPHWVGVVEEVDSGAQQSFRNAGELWRFIGKAINSTGGESRPEADERN